MRRSTQSIAITAAGSGFVAALRASQACACDGVFAQWRPENQFDHPARPLDRAVIYRLCKRGHCRLPDDSLAS
ncbi:hypothetical protein CNO08_07955 [Lysobacter capsici]|nr:hypothetical protein CNO08_07955 [Lysobacter capsici]